MEHTTKFTLGRLRAVYSDNIRFDCKPKSGDVTLCFVRTAKLEQTSEGSNFLKPFSREKLGEKNAATPEYRNVNTETQENQIYRRFHSHAKLRSTEDLTC